MWHSGSPGSKERVTFFSGDSFRQSELSSSLITLFNSKSVSMNSIVPASIFDKSRMSLMSCSSKVLLFSMMLTYSCFSSSSSVEANIPENPTMALSGVRISWLMLARNADFSLFDSSARFLAETSSVSIFFRLVITSEEPTRVSGLLFSS